MPRGQKTPVHKALRQLPLDVPADFVLQLDAYCDANFGSPRAKVIRQAVTEFIEREIRENPGVKRRYEQALEKLQKERFTVFEATPMPPKKRD